MRREGLGSFFWLFTYTREVGMKGGVGGGGVGGMRGMVMGWDGWEGGDVEM